jgi:peptidoglycan/xylan/chitin deacetylase (PgdA/CDA1 family)
MTILCYHAVRDDWNSALAVSTSLFEHHCAWLSKKRRVVRLDEGLQEMRDFRLPRGDVSITFDDGFDDLHQSAFPILRRYGLPATVFVVAERVGPSPPPVDWIDHPPRVPLRTLTQPEILELRDAGISFGSHGLDHQDLTQLSDDECERHLRTSRELLEGVLDEPVRWLAYPRGRHNERVRRAAKNAGFTHAFSMHEPGQPVGTFAIPRVGIFRNNHLITLRAKTSRWYPKIRRDPRLAAVIDRVRRDADRRSR